ncbi:MAG TPA: RNA polymerase sigma factor [Phycisphaerae bacterium]|nr:RNA polymerase sigma factor [Phycisphaerae bacterium]
MGVGNDMWQGGSGQSDRPLVLAAQRGERAAMQLLVARDGRWVRGLIGAMVGEADAVDDIAQQVWLAVWQRIRGLRDPDRWRAWLWKVARSVVVDAGRQNGRRREVLGGLERAEDVPAVGDEPGRRVAALELHRRVLGAVRGLPAIYREPFVLRHLEGWSYRQIGEALDLSTETVETRLVRARRLLREALTGLRD